MFNLDLGVGTYRFNIHLSKQFNIVFEDSGIKKSYLGYLLTRIKPVESKVFYLNYANIEMWRSYFNQFKNDPNCLFIVDNISVYWNDNYADIFNSTATYLFYGRSPLVFKDDRLKLNAAEFSYKEKEFIVKS